MYPVSTSVWNRNLDANKRHNSEITDRLKGFGKVIGGSYSKRLQVCGLDARKAMNLKWRWAGHFALKYGYWCKSVLEFSFHCFIFISVYWKDDIKRVAGLNWMQVA